MSDVMLSEIYKIRKTESGKYEVYNPANNHVFGTHGSEKDAVEQQRALYVNAPPDKEKVREDDHDADDLHEMAYDASVGDENFAYVPKGEPPSARKFKIGDAEHTAKAVSAFVNWSFRGNTPNIPASAKPGMKSKIAVAVRKFFKGAEQKYYLSWLASGKKPGAKPMAEMIITTPFFTADQQTKFPDVPTTPGVNVTRLTEGDPKPVFVTRPLAILGGVSKNGLVYDAPMLDFIQEQVATKRPAARRGHVSEMNRTSEFPPDEGYWIGVMRDNGEVFGKPAVFGKAYLIPGHPLHEMVPLRDAAGTPISNSIWGMASTVEHADGTQRCVALDLETIDFCPAERASLQDLGGDFKLTSEMEGDETLTEQVESTADLALIKTELGKIASGDVNDLYKALSETGHARACAESYMRECDSQAVHEMLTGPHRRHVAEAYMAESAEELFKTLSDEHKQHIAEAYAAATGKKLVPHETEVVPATTLAEMAGMKTQLAEMSKMQQQLAEMDTTIKRYQRQEFDQSITEAVNRRLDHVVVRTDDGKKKMASLKANLRIHVIAEMAGSTKIEDIEPATTRAYESETFKPMAELFMATLAGPSAFVGVNPGGGGGGAANGYDKQTGRYDEEQAKQARAKLNL